MSSIVPGSELSVADICKALESRVAVRESASPELLLRAEQELNLRLPDFYRELYLSFNGFAGYDEKSWICLWPLERVLSEKLRDENRGDAAIAIGDFMVVSDILMCSLADENSSVSLLHESVELAPSMSTFFARFLDGEFDF